jgi:hypothetical protein
MKIRPLHDRVIVKRLEEDRTSAGGMARRCDGRHNLAFYDMPAARLMCGAVRSTPSRADYGRRVVGSAASPLPAPADDLSRSDLGGSALPAAPANATQVARGRQG